MMVGKDSNDIAVKADDFVIRDKVDFNDCDNESDNEQEVLTNDCEALSTIQRSIMFCDDEQVMQTTSLIGRDVVQ